MDSIKELLTTGKQLFENKEYSRAEEYLHQIIDINPSYADVFNMLGVIAHVHGKFTSAMEHFQEALRINPRYTEATLNLAVLYNDLGKYDQAKALYKKLRGVAPKQRAAIEPVLRGKLSNLHADIGDIYRSIGLNAYAIEEYEKALTLNPTYVDIRTKLGQALREHGALKRSLKELQDALKIRKNYPPALIQQGVTYYAMQKVADAKKAWTKALKASPENDYARMYLRLCDATQTSSKMKARPQSSRKGKAKAPSKTRTKR